MNLKLLAAIASSLACLGTVVLSETNSGLTAADLERFANGEAVAVVQRRENLPMAIALGLTSLGLMGWHCVGNPDANADASPTQNGLLANGSASAADAFPTDFQHSPNALPTVVGESMQIAATPESQALFDALNVSEYQWIFYLLEMPLVYLVGGQGSGKTTFAQGLALARAILKGHQLIMVSPHGHQQPDWPGPWIGSGQDFKAIEGAIATYHQRIKVRNGDSAPLCQVWDEFTTYPAKLSKPEQAAELFESLASEPRKAMERHIMIAHSDKKGVAGGKAKSTGFSDLMAAAQKVRLIPRLRPGCEPMPDFRAVVTGLQVDNQGKPITQEVSWPEWFTASSIIALLLQHEGAYERTSRYWETAQSGSAGKDGEALGSTSRQSFPDASIGLGSGGDAEVEAAIALLREGSSLTAAIRETWGVEGGRKFAEHKRAIYRHVAECCDEAIALELRERVPSLFS